jgi:hypothetical protein
LLIVYNKRDLTNPAGLDFRYDLDRNKIVDTADTLIARAHNTSLSGRLLLISPGSAPAPKLTDDPDDPSAPPDDPPANPNLGGAMPPQPGAFSPPKHLSIHVDGDGTLIVECAADSLHAWQLESATSLAGPGWQLVSVKPQIAKDGIGHRWKLPMETSSGPRFYRVGLARPGSK